MLRYPRTTRVSSIRAGSPRRCASARARSQESYPFLTEQRFREIAAEQKDGPAGGPAVRVKDLVSYVAWQLGRAEAHVQS